MVPPPGSLSSIVTPRVTIELSDPGGGTTGPPGHHYQHVCYVAVVVMYRVCSVGRGCVGVCCVSVCCVSVCYVGVPKNQLNRKVLN